jgi:hypothetical protein
MLLASSSKWRGHFVLDVATADQGNPRRGHAGRRRPRQTATSRKGPQRARAARGRGLFGSHRWLPVVQRQVVYSSLPHNIYQGDLVPSPGISGLGLIRPGRASPASAPCRIPMTMHEVGGASMTRLSLRDELLDAQLLRTVGSPVRPRDGTHGPDECGLAIGSHTCHFPDPRTIPVRV